LTGYLIAGFLFGIIGGMGMGGGIILIPVLTLIFQMSQHNAQSVNLLVFLPMAAAALVMHIKNKLVDYKQAIWLSLAGLAGAFLGTNLALLLDEIFLKKAFGILLIILSICRILQLFKQKGPKKQ
jgi:uncharacterized membrane protein YfcA